MSVNIKTHRNFFPQQRVIPLSMLTMLRQFLKVPMCSHKLIGFRGGLALKCNAI
jgi:hypothetical protein